MIALCLTNRLRIEGILTLNARAVTQRGASLHHAIAGQPVVTIHSATEKEGWAALGMYIAGEVAGGYALGCAWPRCAWRSLRLTERMTAVEEGGHNADPTGLRIAPVCPGILTPYDEPGTNADAEFWRLSVLCRPVVRPGRRAMPSCAIRSWCTPQPGRAKAPDPG